MYSRILLTFLPFVYYLPEMGIQHETLKLKTETRRLYLYRTRDVTVTDADKTRLSCLVTLVRVGGVNTTADKKR